MSWIFPAIHPSANSKKGFLYCDLNDLIILASHGWRTEVKLGFKNLTVTLVRVIFSVAFTWGQQLSTTLSWEEFGFSLQNSMILTFIYI